MSPEELTKLVLEMRSKTEEWKKELHRYTFVPEVYSFYGLLAELLEALDSLCSIACSKETVHYFSFDPIDTASLED